MKIEIVKKMKLGKNYGQIGFGFQPIDLNKWWESRMNLIQFTFAHAGHYNVQHYHTRTS